MLQKQQATQQPAVNTATVTPAVNTATVTPTVQKEDSATILRNLKIATKNLIIRVSQLETELSRVDSTQLSIKKMLKAIGENSEALNLEVEDKGKYSIYALIENNKKIASFVLPNPKTAAVTKDDENLPDWLQE